MEVGYGSGKGTTLVLGITGKTGARVATSLSG